MITLPITQTLIQDVFKAARRGIREETRGGPSPQKTAYRQLGLLKIETLLKHLHYLTDREKSLLRDYDSVLASNEEMRKRVRAYWDAKDIADGGRSASEAKLALLEIIPRHPPHDG